MQNSLRNALYKLCPGGGSVSTFSKTCLQFPDSLPLQTGVYIMPEQRCIIMPNLGTRNRIPNIKRIPSTIDFSSPNYIIGEPLRWGQEGVLQSNTFMWVNIYIYIYTVNSGFVKIIHHSAMSGLNRCCLSSLITSVISHFLLLLCYSKIQKHSGTSQRFKLWLGGIRTIHLQRPMKLFKELNCRL